jgi:hypothetical protein
MINKTIFIIAFFLSNCTNSDEKIDGSKTPADDSTAVKSAPVSQNPIEKSLRRQDTNSTPKGLGENCSDELPDSQKGSACWDYDVDGDGKLDRARIAAVGEFAYVQPIAEIPEDGDTFLPSIDLKQPIIGFTLSSDGREQASNLMGASELYFIDKNTIDRFSISLKGCLIEGENPIALAKGKTENVVITFDDGILSLRRC